MTPEERHSKIENEIEKQNEAIRGLIAVGRTCLDSIKEMREVHDADHKRLIVDIDKLREAQASSDEKLNILLQTVDEIIRKRKNEQ